MHNNKMFDTENVGQVYEVQHSQMMPFHGEYQPRQKSYDAFFCDSSHRFQDINVSNFRLII